MKTNKLASEIVYNKYFFFSKFFYFVFKKKKKHDFEFIQYSNKICLNDCDRLNFLKCT